MIIQEMGNGNGNGNGKVGGWQNKWQKNGRNEKIYADRMQES